MFSLRTAALWLALSLAVAPMGAAAAPETSLRPVARTGLSLAWPDTPAPVQALVPVNTASLVSTARQFLTQGAFAALPPLVSLRPQARPGSRAQPARVQVAAQLPQSTPALRVQPVASQRQTAGQGTLCRNRDIQGEVVGYVPGHHPECGIRDAVRVTSFDGVKLSTPALMNCRTAKIVNRWVKRGMKRSVGNYGGGVTSIHVVGHYVCRTRNHQPGAKISEHGKGNAIDIAGFTFADGSKITVLDDWGNGREGRILRNMHRRACGPFGTVLGPDADRFHKDHFHFDTARHSYCR